MLNVSEIRKLVVSHLSEDFPPLLLSFYGDESQQREGFVVIGNDFGTDLGVRLSDGAVYSIDPISSVPGPFVNSSIKQLAACIGIYKSVCVEEPALPRYATVQELRAALEQVDRAAFSDEDNWWVCIIDDPMVG